MFPLYRSVDSLCKPDDWFLYNGRIVHWRIKRTCLYAGKYWSVETRILAYFADCERKLSFNLRFHLISMFLHINWIREYMSAAAYSDTCQASKMKLFMKKVNCCQALAFFAKSFISDIWTGVWTCLLAHILFSPHASRDWSDKILNSVEEINQIFADNKSSENFWKLLSWSSFWSRC